MSVIQTIRNKYGKIAGGVIAVALVGFIVSDARTGSIADFFSGKESNVMKVNGVKIEPKEYEQRRKEFETLYSMFNRNRPLDEAARAQMNEQLSQTIVYEAMVEEQCDKLGIRTTDEEIKELIYGANAHSIVQQFQIDGQQIFISQQTQAFDPQIIKAMEKELAEQPQRVDPSGKVREQWEAVKSYVKRTSRVEKFNTLFAGSAYASVYQTKRLAADQGSMASIRYVKVPFASIPDNEVKVSDDDLKAYMQKHPGMFTNDQPTRTIEYVSFDINPAAADSMHAIAQLDEVKTDLENAKDYRSFVNNRSDDADSYTDAYLNKRTFMSRYSDTIMTMPVGSIYGPYYENGGYKITKVVDRKTLPDSVKVRYILVRTKDKNTEILSDTMAKQRIDSAIAAIRSGATFDSMVVKYSEDDKSKGGENTFTLQQRPGIPKEFGDFIFEGQPKETKSIKVSNDAFSGYFYAEILEHNGVSPSVQLATISKSLAPSDSTVSAIFGQASEFSGKHTTSAEFDAGVKEMKLDKRIGDDIKKTSFSIQGLGAAREVVRWAYEHEVGEISPVFQLGDQRYVVAKLSSVQDKGMKPLTAAIRPMLEQRVREEMKADILAKKFDGAKSIDEIVAKTGQAAEQSDSVTFGGGFIPNLGYEPKVVGYAFNNGFQLNTLSPGIKGVNGVYYISVLNRNVPTVGPEMVQMLGQQRGMMENQMRNAIGQMLQQSVVKKANVKYNVTNF